MGAIKSIPAAQLALQTNSDKAMLSSNNVASTMWETAFDKNIKYKETTDGGWAIQVPLSLAQC